MYGEAGRLVEDEQARVPVQDAQGRVLGGQFAGGFRQLQAELLATAQFGAGFAADLPVHPGAAGRDGFLDAGSGHILIGQSVGPKHIEAQRRRLPGSRFENRRDGLRVRGRLHGVLSRQQARDTDRPFCG